MKKLKRIYKRIFTPTAWQIEQDAWSLDWAMAKWITPRLKCLHKNNIGYPDQEFKTFNDWQKQIKEFIWLFEVWQQSDITDDKYWSNRPPHRGNKAYYRDKERAEKAWASFVKYYNNLWW